MQKRNFYLYIGGQPVAVNEEVYREYRRAEGQGALFYEKAENRSHKNGSGYTGNILCPQSGAVL